MTVTVDLGGLGFDQGAHLLLDRALAEAGAARVVGTHPDLQWQLVAWGRVRGHDVAGDVVTKRRGAARTFDTGPAAAPVPRADPRWGVAGRSAAVEQGLRPFRFGLVERDEVWTEDLGRLYQQAAAAQWDPGAIDWAQPLDHPDEVEQAVVQVMTYLIENETAALLVPARFIGEVHPVFRETQQLLAITVADEARHIEVFTRRALLRRDRLGTSSAGGQTSLRTLIEEPDYALASFLLSVLGEGSFLVLLRFLATYGPDGVTRDICRLAAVDEARHVAGAMAHLKRHLTVDPGLRGRLALAVERRHDALAHTSGLNADVFDALVLIAAGRYHPDAIRDGWSAVAALTADMDHGRRVRMRQLGFDDDDAARLSGLHTRNFM